jgi:hypothetical protein
MESSSVVGVLTERNDYLKQNLQSGMCKVKKSKYEMVNQSASVVGVLTERHDY